ncbi:FtsX-like permease family protein [Streptomyces sp. BE303]|uniref:FtsX-like permease family protein n=1 Tax=Streptomyces sp. BE303 TaxID=3002528 RepID=UPI002E792D71|nr:FtsX-like permease family protein [Streptomyces sp. BE303]MED7952011.1 ABC transporter permease [Streptomyces sp. BE303]
MLGFVVRRLRGRLPLASAALLTVLITTAVLTALVAFQRTVGEVGQRQALQGAGHPRTTVVVNSEHGLDKRAKDETAVADYNRALFGELPTTVHSLARSRSYGLPDTQSGSPSGSRPSSAATGQPSGQATGQPTGQSGGKEADLTLLATLDRERVTVLAGTLPAVATAGGAGGPVQAAVPQTVLTRLGLTAEALPADVRLADRYGGAPLTVRITGLYRATDATDLYWRLDPLQGREIQAGGFTTYGPLLVDDSVFTAAGVPQNGRSWLLDADFAGTAPATVDALRARAAGLGDELAKNGGLIARSELPDLLDELESSALVARSTLLIGALQLIVLAAAALLLVVHLIATRQQSENALLAARGASGARLGAFTALEATLLALPAALLAPLLTPPLLRVLGGFGPLRRVPLDTGLSWTLWPVSVLCALGCVLLAAVPAVLRGAGAAVLRRAGRRQALASGAARSGADLALLALAVLAYHQLSQYSGGLSPDSDGRLGLDPVLVATPTLALCAGTLLALRLLPLAARLGARLAARGRGLAPALVGWQLARRPGRASGPVLLLVLGVSTGVLALGQHATWNTSQQDQASFTTAGGLRIYNSKTAPMGQGSRYSALPGGDRVLPVVRQEQSLPDNGYGQVLILDAAGFADRVPVRSDLLENQDPHTLFDPLAQAAPTGAAAGVPLPGRPQRIDADVTFVPREQAENPRDSYVIPSKGRPEVWVLLRDRYGLTFQAPLIGVPASGEGRATADLRALTDAPLSTASAPLSVVGLIVSADVRDGGELTVRRISAADAADAPAAPAEVPAGLTWAPTGSAVSGVLATEGRLGGADAQQLFKVRYRPVNGASGSVRGVYTPVAAAAAGAAAAGTPQEVAGVATRGFLTANGGAVGETVRVPVGPTVLRVRISAVVESLPVVGDKSLLLDLATVSRALAAEGRETPVPAEWWLPATGSDDPAPAGAAAALRAAPGTPDLKLREEVAAALTGDPLSAAPQNALAAIAVVTTVLAAIGFGAASAAAAGERSREFALLLALGTPRRRLVRTAASEQAVLVGLGSLVGLGLGALIVHLIVPLVVLTPAARRPVPEAVVDLPVGTAVLLAVVIAAVPLLSALLGGRRRRDVAQRLRNMEEM